MIKYFEPPKITRDAFVIMLASRVRMPADLFRRHLDTAKPMSNLLSEERFLDLLLIIKSKMQVIVPLSMHPKFYNQHLQYIYDSITVFSILRYNICQKYKRIITDDIHLSTLIRNIGLQDWEFSHLIKELEEDIFIDEETYIKISRITTEHFKGDDYDNLNILKVIEFIIDDNSVIQDDDSYY